MPDAHANGSEDYADFLSQASDDGALCKEQQDSEQAALEEYLAAFDQWEQMTDRERELAIRWALR